jgi:kinesin family protein 5
LKPSQNHPGRSEITESLFRCDHVFSTDASQEQVYGNAIGPVLDAVIKGYNGAVIAYGQTGSGKTHTMIGSARGKGQGITPRAVGAVFAALNKAVASGASWTVEVSVLEIYNERVRDLLATGVGVTTVEIHEVKTDAQSTSCFRCHDATTWPVESPDDALAALSEGVRRRETARTDMNHHSSRSHLIFTLCIAQTDHEAGATLRSRLHLVDLAGSERLKRSMATAAYPSSVGCATSPSAKSAGGRPPSLGAAPAGGSRTPREQRREAGEINRSLSQLALVIQRLTTAGPAQHVPYRDSVLTRLLAESFGGSSKTCLIVACSTRSEDREETRSSLDFGRRAKQVRNKPEINIEVRNEPSAVMKALLMKELADLQRERDSISCERDVLLKQREKIEAREKHAQHILNEATAQSLSQQEEKAMRVRSLEEDVANLHEQLRDAQEAQITEAQLLGEERNCLQGKVSVLTSELEDAHKLRIQNLELLQSEQAEQRRCWEFSLAQKEEELINSTSRVSNLFSECSSLQNSQKDAAAKIAQLQGERSTAISKCESHSAALGKRWCEDVSELRSEKLATVARLEGEKATLRQQLREALCNVSQLQEQNTTITQQAQESKVMLSRQLQEECLQIKEEKAEIVASLEEEKVAFHKRWQDDISNLQESKSAIVSQLETEKSQLLRKLQAALEESRRLQGEQVAAEAKLAEERAAMQAGLDAERTTAQRKWQEEFSRLLEGKAAEASKMELLQLQLHRQMTKQKEQLEEVHHKVVSQLEAEKTQLHRNWETAMSESVALQREKADLVCSLEGKAASAMHQWEKTFLDSVSWLRAGVPSEAPVCSLGAMANPSAQFGKSSASQNLHIKKRETSATASMHAEGEDGNASCVAAGILGNAASFEEARFFPAQCDFEAEQTSNAKPTDKVELSRDDEDAHRSQADTSFSMESTSEIAEVESASKWGSVWSPKWPHSGSPDDSMEVAARKLQDRSPQA